VLGEDTGEPPSITLASAVVASASGHAAEIVFGNREAEISTIPISYALHPNFPNPFNPVTTLQYDLPEPGPVTLHIYNLLGQKVCTLVDAEIPAGRHSMQWQGRDDRGRPMPTGIYFVRFQAGGVIQHNKITLLK
jgi:hypothetical protein